MTSIRIYRSDQGILGFSAKGHAGFRRHGEDVVCAAISAVTQTVVIGLEDVVRIAPVLAVEEGHLECMLPPGLTSTEWDHAQVVLNTLVKGLEAIEKEHGKYLQLKEVYRCE